MKDIVSDKKAIISMKARKLKTGAVLLMAGFLLVNCNAFADTHYVVTNSPGFNPPYTSWETAGTNIIDVVNATSHDDTVLVSNGVYVLTNVVSVTRTNLTIKSMNGRELTIVDGNGPGRSYRCFELITSNVLDGFTVRNGCGGISASGPDANRGPKIYNCRVANNLSTNDNGGGIYASYCQITNCQIIANVNTSAVPGAVYPTPGNANCQGAGIYASGSTISGCVIASNRFDAVGSYDGNGVGMFVSVGSVISNCLILANIGTNTTRNTVGGGAKVYQSIIRNSLVYGNKTTSGAGGLIVQAGSGSPGRCQNCTVVSNYTKFNGGGIQLSANNLNTGSVENTIIYQNSGANSSNIFLAVTTATDTGTYELVYSCLGRSYGEITNGSLGGLPANARLVYTNNLGSTPQFVNMLGNNYHLSSGSPCINTGTNQDWMTNAVDLDGRMRIRYGTVDMGAYEYINAGTIYGIR